ncbi:unnamed protein product [Rotaria socialis]|uniref:F-box domain-containing protein n=1 Tax=Rotaria socialis TaxID=392032 RepID=A0A817ZC08_9BILA|nr:unnamed protein product [Rotaria socialis]CAF4471225.1 unnamed protein product [Rotaria socialis]
MNQSSVHLLDLPNEMLFNILKKLDNVDVLYSLAGINNERLDSITREETFSKILNFSLVIRNTKIIDAVLDRFCNYILPRIHYNVKCLIVEPTSMERILLATDYPNLTELKIFNFQRDSSLRYFKDDSSLRYIFKKQITKLDLINKDCEVAVGSWDTYTKIVYAHILTYCENLEHLKIIATPTTEYPGLSVRYLPASAFSSSTLTYLCISVITITDCLYLLDGRLKQLNTFIVRIYCTEKNSSIVHNTDDLPNLKCFSLIQYDLIEEYDNKIIALLGRMLYLEKLTLYLRIACENVFIDPIRLINEFSTYSPRLHSFKFYLSTEHNINDLVCYLSNNDIKQNYMNKGYQEVSNIVCFAVDRATYHIFTLPFEFMWLLSIGTIFPNIVFNNVIELSVHDVVPFEHKFFLRIAKAFPLLRNFYVSDLSSLSYNAKKSSDNILSYQIVEYPYLTLLDIARTNTTYVEQFLNETKTHLPCLTELRVGYEDLRIITEDFTREVTRRNCINVTRLITRRQIVGSKDFYIYFPLL